MSDLIMLVGVSYSGKSFYAEQLAKQTGAVIVSSDAIRGELWGDENDQRNPAKVFEVVHSRIHNLLKEGKDVIYDATNLNCKRRMNFLKTIEKLAKRKTCVVVMATLDDIQTRAHKRERKVPMEVVHRQITQFQCPNYYEGWDNIIVEHTSTIGDCYKAFETLWRECIGLKHDNPHHTLDVYEHMEKSGYFVFSRSNLDKTKELDVFIARIHDIGKARTKTFTDAKGNPTEIAHFRGHQNYGAYFYLLYFSFNIGHALPLVLDDACLIQWHMEHCLRGNNLDKFYKMIGPELTERLHILEEADKYAH